MTLDLYVNGATVQVEANEESSLLAVLREQLNLTGSKYGCAEGECGACTVLVDGGAVRSCITYATDAQGKQILTIEGLESQDRLHPLQQAFLDNGAFQCGYCTPGMIMSALALLNSCPNPSREDIVSAMEGNICRCGTYRRIMRAIQQAAGEAPGAEMRASRPTHEQTLPEASL